MLPCQQSAANTNISYFLELQSCSVDNPLEFEVACPQNGTAVLKGLSSHPCGDRATAASGTIETMPHVPGRSCPICLADRASRVYVPFEPNLLARGTRWRPSRVWQVFGVFVRGTRCHVYDRHGWLELSCWRQETGLQSSRDKDWKTRTVVV